MAFATHEITHPQRSPRIEKTMFSVARRAFGRGLQRAELTTRHGIRIVYWRLQPGNYQLHGKLHVADSGRSFGMEFSFGSNPALSALPPRGTVVTLHGWGMDGLSMAFWAEPFARHGYEVLMPDLRGHGKSSKAPVGYGPREAGDIVSWLRQLDARAPLARPIVLLGESYGADVALFAAPKLPDVDAVIALEPFANAADAIMRVPASGILGHKFLSQFMTPARMRKAIKRADRKLGINLERISPAAALARSRACTLIVRGAQDRVMTAEALHGLVAVNPRASYVEVDHAGHLMLPMEFPRLTESLVNWLDKVLVGGSSCPAPPLPLPLRRDGKARSISF